MKVAFFVAPLLAAVAAALPATAASAAGNQMIQYCDSDNLQGSCTSIYDGDEYTCISAQHATKSIKVSQGFGCHLFLGGCSWSDMETWYAGVFNIDSLWNESKTIECYPA
ncbi:hypothetical protein PG985_006276 [Apiospora marii]|uniref:Uncharacterized protein n=1 Tax=Apiospora marii TaxID=335849 RepID=A0ABR1S747_9PEZI